MAKEVERTCPPKLQEGTHNACRRRCSWPTSLHGSNWERTKMREGCVGGAERRIGVSKYRLESGWVFLSLNWNRNQTFRLLYCPSRLPLGLSCSRHVDIWPLTLSQQKMSHSLFVRSMTAASLEYRVRASEAADDLRNLILISHFTTACMSTEENKRDVLFSDSVLYKLYSSG